MDPLQFLLDTHAIEQVYIRYCEVIDSKDFDRLDEVFTADCIGDYRATNGMIQQGLAPLVAHLHRNMGPASNCGATQHNVSNFRIAIAGDTAQGKAHFYAVHQGVRAAAGSTYTCWGQYEDDWVRSAAGWRVSRRLYRNYLVEGSKQVIRLGEVT